MNDKNYSPAGSRQRFEALQDEADWAIIEDRVLKGCALVCLPLMGVMAYAAYMVWGF